MVSIATFYLLIILVVEHLLLLLHSGHRFHARGDLIKHQKKCTSSSS